MTIRVMQGDCRELMKTLPTDSVDSIVCDPPYELTSGKKGGSGVKSINLDSPFGRSRIGTGEGAGGFMGLKWDSTGVALDPATWIEALRVLKPGGHLVAFGGTRTFHRLACAIEDAGFELRDGIGYAHEAEEVTIPVNECPWLLAWTFGSGFPKSMDVSKEIDRQAGAVRTEVVGVKPGHEDFVDRADAFAAGGRADGWDRPWKADPAAIADSHMVKAPVTDAARQWQGWGTALKPAWEPIVLARKPLAKGSTVAGNVVAHGTGALNIDACRIPVDDSAYARNHSGDRGHAGTRDNGEATSLRPGGGNASDLGRWPANVILEDSPQVREAFPESAGQKGPVSGDEPSASTEAVYNPWARSPAVPRGDDGSAARYFYTPKASARDRHEGHGKNHHPTVKPTDLMRYLCRLVTPPGGTILDLFMGSGSTLKAAELEGFSAIGMELDEGYCAIARERISGDAPLFREVQT